MTQNWWEWLFTWEGKVGRLQYLLTGTLLTALKFVIDWSVAHRFGETWRIWNYILPPRESLFLGMGGQSTRFVWHPLADRDSVLLGRHCPYSA
jgi:hypothetical protein